MGWCWIYRHFVHVLFERLICAGLKRNSIEDLEKNSGENVLLKNTMQVQQTCVKNHQFLKIEQKIPCWDISGFFFTKKIIKNMKKCSKHVRWTCAGLFFTTFFFNFCKNKSRACSSDVRGILPYTATCFGLSLRLPFETQNIANRVGLLDLLWTVVSFWIFKEFQFESSVGFSVLYVIFTREITYWDFHCPIRGVGCFFKFQPKCLERLIYTTYDLIDSLILL